ncbi:MAG TPA: BlaI/MecI/CopY family transcriptional regulator [Planctomycetaceae bacterium]|jgi:predicted transcriptional regulator|nr:BlaI/MecI/CopY family transcriptional regulator [Planctomycetaceae bacterium]
MKPKSLTRCELEIADIVWTLGEATVQDVCDNLTRPLAYTTVMTTLSHLESKKNILTRVKRGRAYVYRPCVSREEVSSSMLAEVRDVLFGGSISSLVLSLLSQGPVPETDIQALRAALDEVEKQS